MKKDYNVIVIGAGAGGLVSAYICAVLKAKVALIEKHKMGGDCLNTGCVPSKALIRTTAVLAQIKRHKDFGLKHATVEFDFAEVMERVQRVIKKVAPHDSIERYTEMGVECLQGEAEIISPHEVKVNGKILTTKNIIVATGASPAIPSLPGLDQVPFLHTENLWDIREQPKRLLVLGGGPIGAEITQCFARLGTQVTQVQKAAHLLPREDEQIVSIMEDRFKREGVDLRLGMRAVAVTTVKGQKSLKVEGGGNTAEIPFDDLLLAVGRRPHVKGFGLEDLGIQLDEGGRIKTDAYGRTSTPNIFACGDVTSRFQFTHMAAHQAWYCAVNAVFGPFVKFKIDWSTVPWCTYTDPEIARVGINEKEARDQGIAYEVSEYPLDDLDRAIADEEDHGLVRVLTVPGKDKLLGVTICGYHAGDLLPEFVMAHRLGLGLNKILGMIHVYPTMAEANKYVAGVWKKANSPEKLLKILSKFHTFRR